MGNFFKDNDDLRYYFDKGIDWASLADITEHGFHAEGGHANTAEAVDFYRSVAELAGSFVAEEIAPHAAQVDAEAVRFEAGEAVLPQRLASIFERIRALDLHGMCLPRELGGQNCPLLLHFVNAELFARGDVSVMAHHSFHGGMALAMLVYSIQEGSSTFDTEHQRIASTRFQKEIDEIARGAAFGCMDITEPNAGSDMAALRAVGEQDAAGNWFVTGDKIFITSGHGKYHFVIARTEEAKDPTDPFAGLSGLSMFLVPAYEDLPDGGRRRIVTIDRLEEKMGHHGSVTASLHFERAPAMLIGKRGEGFRYMLTLMNNARLSVGFECIGLAEAALRAARAYAEERRSMGKAIARHELIADYLEEMETDIIGLRALGMYGAFHEEMAQKTAMFARYRTVEGSLEAKRWEHRCNGHKARSRRVTPLLKYLAAEKSVEIARRAVQIHGGAGFMREYGMEKLVRDAMVMPIYEGTSQIQALMAMKDCLASIISRPQEFAKRMAQARGRASFARDPLERKLARVELLSLTAQQHLTVKTATTKLRSLRDVKIAEWPRTLTKNWDPKRDFALAMLHAERLTRILADEAIGQRLVAQARKHPERRPLAERYLDRAEPRCRFLHDEITTTGARLLEGLREQRAQAEKVA